MLFLELLPFAESFIALIMEEEGNVSPTRMEENGEDEEIGIMNKNDDRESLVQKGGDVATFGRDEVAVPPPPPKVTSTPKVASNFHPLSLGKGHANLRVSSRRQCQTETP